MDDKDKIKQLADKIKDLVQGLQNFNNNNSRVHLDITGKPESTWNHPDSIAEEHEAASNHPYIRNTNRNKFDNGNRILSSNDLTPY